MAEKHTCEVAAFKLHANSKVPRPMLVRKRKHASPVYRQTLLHDAPLDTVPLKFPALKSTPNEQPSRIPLPCPASNQFHHDESLSTSQTSASAYARRKPSGRSNLLHKIQTISIRTNSSESDSSKDTFTRLQPLPAISGLTTEESLLNMEDFSINQNLSNDIRPVTSEWCTRTSVLPIEVDQSYPGCTSNTTSLERISSPSITDSPDASTTNTGESQIWEEETEAETEKQNVDLDMICMPLFEKIEQQTLHCYEDDNTVAERPKTSHPLNTHSNDEQFLTKPLVRSNTYDILPTVYEEESSDIKTTATSGVNSPSEMDYQSADSVLLEENPHHDILLTIQTSPGEYIYGYFEGDNRLQSVLDFASKMRGCSFEGYRLKLGDASQQPLGDLSQTIAQTKLKHRNLLLIYKDDV